MFANIGKNFVPPKGYLPMRIYCLLPLGLTLVFLKIVYIFPIDMTMVLFSLKRL